VGEGMGVRGEAQAATHTSNPTLNRLIFVTTTVSRNQ